MKRVLSFMTIAAMLIAMTALPAAAEKVQNAAGDWELMNEKFDNDTVVSEGTFNIAKKTGESYTVVDAAEESLPDAAAHGKVVKIAKDASGNVDNYFRIAYSGTKGVIADQCDNPKEELKRVRTSFDMYLPNLLGGANLRFFNTLNGSTQASNLIGLTASGNMNFINGESIPYSAKTWYHFDIYFDFTGGNKCTIYRNNELVADNIDTYAGVTNKMLRDALISFGLQVGGTADAYSLYMDNMQFVIPGDFQMLSSVPENGAENVEVMKPVTLNFNHPAPNADTAGITVSADGTPVEGVTVSEKNGVVTIAPPGGRVCLWHDLYGQCRYGADGHLGEQLGGSGVRFLHNRAGRRGQKAC